MAYAYITTFLRPHLAVECEVCCTGQAGPTIMALLEASPKTCVWTKGSMIKYDTPSPPIAVINLLEKQGYKVVDSAANEKGFVWTMRQDLTEEVMSQSVIDELEDKFRSNSSPEASVNGYVQM